MATIPICGDSKALLLRKPTNSGHGAVGFGSLRSPKGTYPIWKPSPLLSIISRRRPRAPSIFSFPPAHPGFGDSLVLPLPTRAGETRLVLDEPLCREGSARFPKRADFLKTASRDSTAPPLVPERRPGVRVCRVNRHIPLSLRDAWDVVAAATTFVSANLRSPRGVSGCFA